MNRAGKLEKSLKVALEALALYGAPDSYHAIAFTLDPPSGWFADDFSYVRAYRRKMPGRLARMAITEIARTMRP